MFNTGSQPTGMESMVESADPDLESADSTADSATNPLKIGLWVRPFIKHTEIFACDSLITWSIVNRFSTNFHHYSMNYKTFICQLIHDDVIFISTE